MRGNAVLVSGGELGDQNRKQGRLKLTSHVLTFSHHFPIAEE